MRPPLRTGRVLAPARSLLAALGATAGAALAQQLVLPHPAVAPFVFFFLAVALVGWLRGRRAGLLTVLSSALTANWLHLAPAGHLKLSGEALGATLLFVLGASPIALLCGVLRRRVIAAESASVQLSEQAALLARSVVAAREAEERFRSLAENSPDLIARFDRDMRHLYANAAALRATGLSPAQLVGRTNAELGMPADLTAFWEGRLRAVFESGAPRGMEFELPGADGPRVYESRIVPELERDGHVASVLVTTRDVTEHKRSERALRESEERLADSDRRKGEFLGVLSHELRNPLAPIRNSLHVAARSAPGSEQHRRAMQVIERQVAHLHRLVDDLLDVTRISRGKVHLERKRVDLVEVARGVVEDHQELFRRRGLELVLADGDGPLHVLADAARLVQVIGNLLQNAAKFSSRGARTTVTIRPADDRLAELWVEDTGRGIPPEVLGRLFEPFVQADTSLDRSMGGLGLGLALVKGLVELHGGTVEAHSDGPGRGARFRVTILRERRKVPRPEPERPRGAAPSPRRILIIEDNQDAAETLKDALELDGHAVALAFTGIDGVELARSMKPDAIICDIGLPGMNGLDVARTLRTDPALDSSTLIALSGYALAEDVERATTAGFDRHLAKPPDLDELQRSIVEPPRHAG